MKDIFTIYPEQRWKVEILKWLRVLKLNMAMNSTSLLEICLTAINGRIQKNIIIIINTLKSTSENSARYKYNNILDFSCCMHEFSVLFLYILYLLNLTTDYVGFI